MPAHALHLHQSQTLLPQKREDIEARTTARVFQQDTTIECLSTPEKQKAHSKCSNLVIVWIINTSAPVENLYTVVVK